MESSSASLPFAGKIVGQGEMATLTRAFDWSSTPLGPVEGWSEALLSYVNLLLCSPLPATLSWGEGLTFFYNDAAIPTLGERHPAALGCGYRKVFADVWHLVGPDMEDCFFRGQAPVRENVCIPLVRRGQVEEGYYTYALVPVYEHGRIHGVYDPYQNTTRTVLAERNSVELEAKFRTFVEAVSDVVYRVSADWSQALEVEGRGFLPDTHAPDPEWFTRNVHPDDQARVLAAIQKAIREESVFEMEHKVQRLDGSDGWTFSRAIPVRDHHGKVVEWFGAASDITARKQAEQALLSSEKLAVVGRLASSIAHEINNPLEAVINLIYIAEQTADPATRPMLELAQKELQRVAHITTNTLIFNRQKLRPTPVDMAEAMKSVLDLYQGRLRQSGVQVSFEVEACPPFEALGGEIRQVFANLVGNAVDAMRRGGRMRIRIRPCTDWRSKRRSVRVTVADNGCGMNAATRAQVYKPFFTTKESTGTGLGLWISAEIVGRHQGSIQVRSCDREGRSGTVFSIHFPLGAAE